MLFRLWFFDFKLKLERFFTPVPLQLLHNISFILNSTFCKHLGQFLHPLNDTMLKRMKLKRWYDGWKRCQNIDDSKEKINFGNVQ